MIDIHTHILHDVDDGAKDIETALKLIEIEVNQGVNKIVLTPHVQSRVTRANLSEHHEKFEVLKNFVKSKNINVDLYLAAEILYQAHIDTKFDDYTFGKEKYILIEFSTRAKTPIEEICFDIMHLGYQVIVAHVERYQYLSIDDIFKIKQTGALLQVNASSILNLDQHVSKKTIKQLIKFNLIDIIASDTHNIEKRPPNLLEAKTYLKKYYKDDELDLLFNRIQL